MHAICCGLVEVHRKHGSVFSGGFWKGLGRALSCSGTDVLWIADRNWIGHPALDGGIFGFVGCLSSLTPTALLAAVSPAAVKGHLHAFHSAVDRTQCGQTFRWV